MEKRSFSEEEVLVAIKDVEESLKAGVFEGIILIAKGAELNCHYKGGSGTQLVNILDFIMMLIYTQKEYGNEETYKYLVKEYLNRAKILLSEL